MAVPPGHSSKVIFLDFDGPLSSHRMAMRYGRFHEFDPVTCGVLDHICHVSGAKIVATSVRTEMRSAADRYETKILFERAGLSPEHMHADWSARDGRTSSRLQHIKSYLATHPEITHYAIVDDEAENDEYHNHPAIVMVEHEDGLQYHHFERIIALLEIDEGLVWQRAREANEAMARAWPRGQLMLEFDVVARQINESIQACPTFGKLTLVTSGVTSGVKPDVTP